MSTSTAPEAAGYRTILALAWPVALGRAAQSIIGFCDAAFVAPLGESSLAATSTGALNAANLFILPTGVAYIIQSFASQLHGKGDREGVRRQAWYGLLLSLVTELFAIASVPLVGRSLSRFAYSAEVRALMTQYLAIRLLSSGPAVGIEALANWYGAQGDTRMGLRANVAVMLSNLVFLWVLVPSMGVRGAAWANVLATWVGFAVVLAPFVRHARGGGPLRLSAREFGRVLRFGLPNGLNWFLEFAAFIVFVNVVFASLGTTALASLMAVMQLNSIAFMPSFGVSTAGAILVGNAIGAAQKDVVPTLLKRTLVVTCGWMVSVGLSYLAAPALLLAVFARGPGAAAFLAVAVPLLRVSAMWQVFDAIGMTISEALRAAGDTFWPLVARLTIAWVFFVPISWWLVRVMHQGPTVTLTCIAGYLAALALAMALRFRAGAWRTITLTEGPSVE